jgi:hypothetical protein
LYIALVVSQSMIALVRAFAAAVLAFAVTATAAAAPPRAGVVVPGKSLGGLNLGATPAHVRAAWGARHGVCRDCPERTWYYNLRKFEPQGVGVSFRRGRAVALFTLWSPPDWRTDRGLAIGDPAERVAALYGSLLRVTCTNYYALTLPRGNTTTAVYVFNDQVWGFALLARGQRVCR